MADATDNFNRASLGSNWTTVTSLATLTISASTVLSGTGGSDSGSYWNADSFDSDQYSQLTAVTMTGDGGILVRVQSGAQQGYLLDSGTTTYQFYRMDAGFTAVGAPYLHTWTAGDTYKLSVTGSTFTPIINGSAAATRSDANFTGGSPGAFVSSGCTWDDWIGGPITAGATGQPTAKRFGGVPYMGNHPLGGGGIQMWESIFGTLPLATRAMEWRAYWTPQQGDGRQPKSAYRSTLHEFLIEDGSGHSFRDQRRNNQFFAVACCEPSLHRDIERSFGIRAFSWGARLAAWLRELREGRQLVRA